MASPTTTDHHSIRHRAASLALAVTVVLTAFKLAVGWISGSVGVLSEGIHSFLDLISASVAFYTVREAIKPADREHPYGHGKFETLSSLFESLLLAAAGIVIIIEAADRLRNPQPITHQTLAIVTLLVSMGISYLIYRHNRHAAQQVDSSAIHVNALHFLTDVIASFGVLVALIVIKVTGWNVVDAVAAFGVAGYILFISAKQVKLALQELSDTRLPEAEVIQIKQILQRFNEKTIEAHDIRTRKSGSARHIDYHLVVCGHMTVNESHALCDQMEDEILKSFPRAYINIHVEPCQVENTRCKDTCRYYQARRGVTP